MNYYLVNLSMADLMITIWCPVQSLVRELSQFNHYILPAVFCKIGVFYTGGKIDDEADIILSVMRSSICDCFSLVHGVKCNDLVSHLLRQILGSNLSTQNQSHSEESEVSIRPIIFISDTYYQQILGWMSHLPSQFSDTTDWFSSTDNVLNTVCLHLSE